MSTGIIIAFDGINGSGKSSMMKRVYDHLAAQGRQVVQTFEPGGNEASVKIRRVALDPTLSEMDGVTETLLFMAARNQNLKEIVKPALEAGALVLTDRNGDASIKSFQHYGKGVDINLINGLRSMLGFEDFSPRLTFIFDLDPDVAAERLASRGDAPERFELMAQAFHHRVRSGYLQQAKQDPERFVIIDASKSQDEIFTQITGHLDVLFAARNVATRCG